MKIHIYHHFDDECEMKKLLKEISCKLDKLLQAGNNDQAIAKAASDLDASTNELKEAVNKNTPAN